MASPHSVRKPASISLLPSEILVMIFENLETDITLSEEERFPHPLTTVCTLWKEVVIANPQFWTRLHVALKSGSKSFRHFETHLQWSHNLPVHVSLSSLSHSHSLASKDEKYCLSTAMKALLPHLHRCKELSIGVWDGWSYPPFSKIVKFLSTCQMLDTLDLSCVFHDACAEPCPSQQAMSPVAWKLPPLTELCLSADNVFLYNGFFDPSPSHTMVHLTLANYNAYVCPGDEHGLRTSSLIEMLRATRAEWITLDNLSLIKEDWSYDLVPLDRAAPNCLECKALDAYLLLAIHRFYQDPPTKCMISDCSIGVIDDFMGDHLFLEELFESQTDDLFFAMYAWPGRHLVLCDCCAFDDSIIGSMTSHVDGSPYTSPRLRQLEIRGSSSISVSALKRLVMFRWDEARKEFEWKDVQEMKEHTFEQVSPIVKLEIDGELSAGFSEEDVEWFESKLELIRQ